MTSSILLTYLAKPDQYFTASSNNTHKCSLSIPQKMFILPQEWHRHAADAIYISQASDPNGARPRDSLYIVLVLLHTIFSSSPFPLHTMFPSIAPKKANNLYNGKVALQMLMN